MEESEGENMEEYESTNADEGEDENVEEGCEGCLYKFEQLVNLAYDNDEKAIEIFVKHGVLLSSFDCVKCSNKCRYYTSSRIFRCVRRLTVDQKKRKLRECKFTRSLMKGTWLGNSKMAPSLNLRFCNIYVRKFFSISYCVENFKLSSATASDWMSFCSEVCQFWFDNQEPIGGDKITVEIDESDFAKTSSDAGKNEEGAWVFGGIERTTKRKFMVPVKDRTAETLLPLIQQFIKPGTIICTDGWSAYKGIKNLPGNYKHSVIDNHDRFINRQNPLVHIQSILVLWKDAKSWIMNPGYRSKNFERHLARFLFASAYAESSRLHHFLKTIAALYPPPTH